jgi:hypothetical protein
VERNRRHTVHAARKHGNRVKRSTGRLLIAGLGFSVAYFFDAAQGQARRKQIVEAIRRERGANVVVRTAYQQDLPRIGLADLSHRATFQRATDGIRVSARV